MRQVVGAYLDPGEHVGLVLRLVVLVALLYGGDSPEVAVPVRVICSAMLVFPSLIQSARVWWLLGVVLALGCMRQWYTVDNHKFLIAYWTLSCALAATLPGRLRLATAARVLIGLVFGFAVAWKLLAGEYLDGSFLYHTALLDTRAEWVPVRVGGIGPAEVGAFRAAVDVAGQRGLTGVSFAVPQSHILWQWAVLSSWLVLGAEALICGLHLAGLEAGYRLRHLMLMAFIVGTYIAVPVLGFGAILSVLGIAQCREDDRVFKAAYLAVWALIQWAVVSWPAATP